MFPPGALFVLEAAGIEPADKVIEKFKQDALLPAITLIFLGFFIPPRPTPFLRVPPPTPLEGHTGGTCHLCTTDLPGAFQRSVPASLLGARPSCA